MRKKTLKSVKKVKDNVIKLPKQTKELKITLDVGTDGNRIKDLNYYFNIDPNRFVTTDDTVILLKGQISKSTLEKNRKWNKDDAGERGPQCWIKSQRKILYKILWLMRYREGLGWIKELPQLKQHYAVTALNIPQEALNRINKN